MAAVEAHLVDPDAGLIKLLDPPLAHAVPSAGYIQAYPPGVRENGGQYSHAGVWALMAQAELAQTADRTARRAQACDAAGDMVYRYFTYLSPAHRASHPHAWPGLRHRALRDGRRRLHPAALSSAAAAGAGTPARPPGCTARPSSRSSACSQRAQTSASRPACPRTGAEPS